MTNEHKYTAQEMREVAEGLVDSCVADNISILVGHGNLKVVKGDRIVSMLRQAADDEEELYKLRKATKVPVHFDGAQVNMALARQRDEFAARLDAVVKECEKQIPACRGEDCKCNPTDGGYCDENCHDEIIVYTAVSAILRAARGEGGEEGANHECK